ncbi:glycosyl hydrolase 115 family protein [Flavisolibacter nicotianae]|uniref:glycosyl hydrolase 115 family protein n=1 Tax=Flavisolibacter nicotianae TaxID=2364882 RepID=UPI000EB176D8|nr:glycosyl hydrolase 115 family protein [Flavisolibacter nicotianae]
MKKLIGLLLSVAVLQSVPHAQNIISDKAEAGAFPIVSAAQKATIVFDEADDTLVQKAAQLLANDIEMVSGKKLQTTSTAATKNIILVGSMGKSRFIQQLVAAKKLVLDSLQNKWEAYQIKVVKNPFKGIEQALVITGSDRRGTAYGVFELSKQIGVSPWWWWADVPVKKKAAIYVKQNAFLSDAPKVKYRGIFINDEAPALSNWSKEKFGGFNHLFYEKVFELILRLKGNYLWPAMWGNAFYDDDPQNRQTADTYGIVIGTSHHEPLMRAHDEWRRYGKGKWNYDSNDVRLQQFWREGVQRATNEKVVTIGMRGDGDEPMSRETATALLERIVKDQRKIIEEVTGKPASHTPQLWALYKEVQDYYDKGMRVPDDVTLLLCDDNWGNIRKLPKLTDKPRSGGYGIYYHFDYVGGPRNYKWINTNNLARVWEQMHLAYEYGVKNIWIVNVGDIKPMELPTSFFLDYAWNPDRWNEDNIRSYYTSWAAQQFGEKQAKEIGDILRRYSQYSARRKPELLDANTYDLTSYNEWFEVEKQWEDLEADAEKINKQLPAINKGAFFQLVLHPVKAFANLYQLYFAVALNRANAKDSNLSANAYADVAKQLYQKDSLITLQYHQLANGKWNHMMAQTHIGYTYWQQPNVNVLPAVTYVSDGKLTDTAMNPGYKIPSAKSLIPKNSKGNLFYEQDGYVSLEAEHWTRTVNTNNVKWKVIPDIGRTGSGITTFPVTASTSLSTTSPHVEYDFYTLRSGAVKLDLYFSPTLNFHNNEGLQYAVSIDDEKPQVFSLNKDDNNVRAWESWVANNSISKNSAHSLSKAGKHTLKYWMISPAVVLQKLVVDLGGATPSYLGPPETKR